MKRFITGALAAVLLLSQISIADVFVKTVEAAAYEDDGIQLLAAEFAGNGTASSPYIISSPEDLTRLAADVNGGEPYSGVYFKLTEDITVTNWRPIGDYDAEMKFSGIFNGGNHVITINGLAPASTPERGYQGLFGNVNGTIQNLTVAGTVHSNARNVGGIVGYLNTEGTIENCRNKASVRSDFGGAPSVSGVGGIAAQNFGTIINCVNEGNIKGNDVGSNCAGGIVGRLEEGSIESCYNTGSVEGNDNCGGIAGYAYPSGGGSITIKNCYNTGKISTSDNYAGGIAGFSSSSKISIINCYSNGLVSGSDRSGIVSRNFNTEIANCYYLEGTAEGGIGTADVSGQAESIGETAFAQQDTFENWDFGSIWKMSVVLGRPILVKPAEYEPPYQVTYHTNSGTIKDEETYTSYYQGKGLTLPEPTRSGYTFAGWYEKADFSGAPVTSITETDYGDKEYYAKWTEEMPRASVDRPNGRLQGLIPGAKYDITYKDAGGNLHTDTVTADENGNLEIKDEWINGTVGIVKKSNGADVVDSEAQELEIPKREPEIAGSLSVTGESTKDAKDGKISGLEPEGRYQISEDGGKTWKDVTANAKGELESLGAGSYEVRRSAGEDTLPSQSVQVTIQASSMNSGTGNTEQSGTDEKPANNPAEQSAADNAGVSGNSIAPKTGDSARPGLWLALTAVGVAGFIGVTATYRLRKRKNKQQ
ncbi:MAG: InlB B-repeat-containing protein [Lachnospiraceae bacterium]|nr:InlB B-repeat-containing protein [Lachnospiraceae bacterium]